MAIKYKIDERVKAMADNLGGEWRNPTTDKLLRYSDLRFNSYPPRGGASDEVAFLKGGVVGLVEGGLNNKLSDMRVGAASVWVSGGSSKRLDQASREMFEGGDAK